MKNTENFIYWRPLRALEWCLPDENQRTQMRGVLVAAGAGTVLRQRLRRDAGNSACVSRSSSISAIVPSSLRTPPEDRWPANGLEATE